MATLKVMLHPINKDKNGKRSIILRVTHVGIKYYVSLGVKDKLFDDEFDPTPGNNCNYIKPTAGVADYKQKNSLIAKRLAEAHSLLLDFEKNRIPVTLERFKEGFQIKKSQDFVFPFFDQVVKHFTDSRKIGNAGIYTTVKNSLQKFRNNNQLRFSDITLTFLQKYEAFLFKEGLKGNGISLYMRTLRAAYNKAIAQKVTDIRLYPFHNLTNPNGYKISDLETATIKRAISIEDIRNIEALETTPYSTKHDSKLYFLFSFYCRGINFTDMALLTSVNIQSGRIVYTRAKTRNKKIFSLEILEPVKEILAYFEKHPFKAGEYLFPILNDKKFVTDQQKKTRIQTALKQLNSDLKTLGSDAKIKIPLTTYVARHSWATAMKNKGISTAQISEGLGHQDEKTTQIYLEDFENSVLDEASRKLLE